MAIKVKFLSGQTSVTLNALHQWDYGQQLEIESEDAFPALVEVHFSCSGMKEAKVRTCSMLSGVATVDIPDVCLEQAGSITAWIFEIDGTQGTTKKTITIPITSRARPDKTVEPTQDQSDRITELITEVNEVVESLRNGDVVVKKAETANAATTAEKATTATTANTAQRADVSNLTEVANTITGGYTINFGSLCPDYFGSDFSLDSSNEKTYTVTKSKSSVESVFKSGLYVAELIYRSGMERFYHSAYIRLPGTLENEVCVAHFRDSKEAILKFYLNSDNTIKVTLLVPPLSCTTASLVFTKIM